MIHREMPDEFVLYSLYAKCFCVAQTTTRGYRVATKVQAPQCLSYITHVTLVPYRRTLVNSTSHNALPSHRVRASMIASAAPNAIGALILAKCTEKARRLYGK